MCGGTGEVDRRGHALVDATGEIELRLVARAEEAAEPIGRRGPRARRRGDTWASTPGACRCRPSPGSGGLIERVSFFAYGGLLPTASSSGSASCARDLRQRREHVRRAVDQPHDLAAPFDVDLLAGLELARCRPRPARRRPSRARSERTTSRTEPRCATAPMPPTTPVAPIRKRRLRASTAGVEGGRSPPAWPPRLDPLPWMPLTGGALFKPDRAGYVASPVAAAGDRREVDASRGVCKTAELYGNRTRAPEALSHVKRGKPTPDQSLAAHSRRRTSRPMRGSRVRSSRDTAHAVYNRLAPSDSFADAPQILAAVRAGVHARAGAALRRRDVAPRPVPRLSGPGNVVLLQQASAPATAVASGRGKRHRRSPRARSKAMPSVVNIYTSKEMRGRNPMPDDSLLRRYFPDLAERLPPQRATSLGSGVIVASDGYVLTNNHVIDGRRRHPARALRRPPHRREAARHRSGDRPRRAEGRRHRPAGDHARLARSACRSATRCSRSAIRSASATR